MWLIILAGCSNWIDQSPACNLDVYEWSDDLLAHILTGDGSGSFDYDPVDIPRTRLNGVYKPLSGDFNWSAEFGGEYWIQSQKADGYGTAYHNGNLDLLYSIESTDRLGESSTTSYRVERTACKMTTSTWSGAVDGDMAGFFTMEGSYDSATSFHWTAEDDSYTYQGGLRQNLSRTSQVEAKDGSYSVFTSNSPQGTATSDWEQYCYADTTDYWCVGNTQQKFNGDIHQEYTITLGKDGATVADATWDYAYEGGGSGVSNNYQGNQTVVCTYEITTNDRCTYSCDDGSSGNCS